MTATDQRQDKHAYSVFCIRHEDRKANWAIVIHGRSNDEFLIITLQAVTLTPKVGTYVNPASANTGEPSENAAHEVRDQGHSGVNGLTGAALDRLTHRCPDETTQLETKGGSDRLQDAKRRRKPA